jgi:anthranilate phosphoribosyltransferase
MPHTIQPITPQEALQRVIEHREIFHDEMLHIMRLIMAGEMSPVLMSAFIAALRVKKETIGEITAAAQVMREFSTKVEVADRQHLVDIVGTGGDGSHTFNISTCSMFVAAAAGAKVSKHGSRSVSSKSASGHWFHVRTQPPPSYEKCGAGAQRVGCANHLQHLGPTHQSCWRTQYFDGRVPS